MVVTGGDGGGSGSQGGPLRLLGYLKANKNVAYVLAIMVLVHLSNQYDRRVIVMMVVAACISYVAVRVAQRVRQSYSST